MNSTLVTAEPYIHPLANVYDSTIGGGTKIAAFAEVGGAVLGARCKIQAFAFIPPGVTLQDEVFVGPHACFTNDRYPRAMGAWRREPTLVERGASIGANATILCGVTIGAGAMIAAGAVVRTSVPAGYLYEERPERLRVKRWYQHQHELGLPLTFDQWRAEYDSLSHSERMAFFDAVYDVFPEQCYCNLTEARKFFATLSRPSRILEIGGWDGRIAGSLLNEFPQISHWYNYELSQKAVAAGLRAAAYSALVPAVPAWELTEFPPCNVFFASRAIEHLRAAELARLVARLDTIEVVYLEARLPLSATQHSWDGRWNAHVLEIGWRQVEDLFLKFGFRVCHAAPDVRCFAR